MAHTLKHSTVSYDSAFEDDGQVRKRKRLHSQSFPSTIQRCQELPKRTFFGDEGSRVEGQKLKYQLSSLNAYDSHKLLINQYVLYHPGATDILKRDNSRDKRDIDVLRENHKFLWDDTDVADTWGKELAKKYYDKLFKEYCICDLTKYKENKIGMRWRIEREVICGDGQFSCGNKHCSENDSLRSWEMNFAYVEHGSRKNCLIKLRLCHDCSYKLNYVNKRKEVTKKRRKNQIKNKRKSKSKSNKRSEGESSQNDDCANVDFTEIVADDNQEKSNVWKGPASKTDEKSRDEEFEEYLEDLFV